MPVLLFLAAVFLPRVMILVLWLMTNWFHGVFQSVIGPVGGFFFLPLTTLWVAVVLKYLGGQWSLIPLVVAAICVVVDVSPLYRRTPRVLANA